MSNMNIDVRPDEAYMHRLTEPSFLHVMTCDLLGAKQLPKQTPN